MRGSTDRSHGLANSKVYLGRYQYSGSKGRCEALLAAADSGGCGGGGGGPSSPWSPKKMGFSRERLIYVFFFRPFLGLFLFGNGGARLSSFVPPRFFVFF